MEKREIDEQLKSLSFDMDEEIDDRNERRGRKAAPPRHAHTPMDPSHAIILAAIIIVGGLWGGKLLYDYIQEQRIKAVFNEAAAQMHVHRKRFGSKERLRKRPESSSVLNNSFMIRRNKRAQSKKNASNHRGASSGGSNTAKIPHPALHRRKWRHVVIEILLNLRDLETVIDT